MISSWKKLKLQKLRLRELLKAKSASAVEILRAQQLQEDIETPQYEGSLIHVLLEDLDAP